jgi:hypothetical protein
LKPIPPKSNTSSNSFSLKNRLQAVFLSADKPQLQRQ